MEINIEKKLLKPLPPVENGRWVINGKRYEIPNPYSPAGTIVT